MRPSVKREEAEGRLLYDLNNGRWNIPELRRLLACSRQHDCGRPLGRVRRPSRKPRGDATPRLRTHMDAITFGVAEVVLLVAIVLNVVAWRKRR